MTQQDNQQPASTPQDAVTALENALDVIGPDYERFLNELPGQMEAALGGGSPQVMDAFNDLFGRLRAGVDEERAKYQAMLMAARQAAAEQDAINANTGEQRERTDLGE